MEQLCALKNLTLSFGPKIIFDQTDFIINRGDHIGLLGLNGKGKSCLIKVISGAQAADTSTPPFNFIKKNSDYGDDFSILHVPQELETPKKKTSIKDYFYYFYPKIRKIKDELDQIANQLETSDEIDHLLNKQKDLMDQMERFDAWTLSKRYESYLKYFDLKDLNADVENLSGGEKRKILLSIGLSSNAELILWDEPTNHLDLESITALEGELLNTNKTFVIISHDRYLLSKVTNKILQIKNAKIESFQGSYTNYLEYLGKEEESRQRLLSRLKNRLQREQDWMNQGVKARGTRSKKRVENFLELRSKVEHIKDQAKKDLSLNLGKSGRKTKIMMQFKDASFSYESENNNLLKNLKLIVSNKDKIGILGPNGSGKSTLLKIMTDELQLTSGNIKRAEDLSIGHFKQERAELNDEESPYDYLGEGTDSVILPDGRKMHVAGYIKKFLFTGEDLYRPLKTFSGGERNRLQLAKNLLSSADIWIFDEPTNDLDLETIQVLEKELINYPGAVIIVSHDRAFLSTITNKIWIIDKGEIEEFHGGYQQAEEYLEISQIEKELKAENTAEENSSQEVQQKNLKPTNKEKERIKKIPGLIQKAEKNLEEVDQKISTFDFSNSSPQQAEEYNQLSGVKEELETTLMELYEEQEELQEKFN